MTGRRALTGAVGAVAAFSGALLFVAVFAGKSQRLHPGDAASGATVATEGVRPWMILAVLLAAATLGLLLLAFRAGARGAIAAARIGALLSAVGFGINALIANRRLADLAAEAAGGRYDVVAGDGLAIVALVAPVGAVAALTFAALLRATATTS